MARRFRLALVSCALAVFALPLLPACALAADGESGGSGITSEQFEKAVSGIESQFSGLRGSLERLEVAVSPSGGSVFDVSDASVVSGLEELGDKIESLSSYQAGSRTDGLLEYLVVSVLLGDGLLVGLVCTRAIGRH